MKRNSASSDDCNMSLLISGPIEQSEWHTICAKLTDMVKVQLSEIKVNIWGSGHQAPLTYLPMLVRLSQHPVFRVIA